MASHSSILAWKIPWTEKPDRLQSMESDTTEQLKLSLSCPKLFQILGVSGATNKAGKALILVKPIFS